MVIIVNNRYAIIENHLVTNVAVAEEEYAVEQGWIPCPDHVGLGWACIDGKFIEPVIELKAPELPPTPTLEELLAQVNQLQAQILLLSGSSNGTA